MNGSQNSRQGRPAWWAFLRRMSAAANAVHIPVTPLTRPLLKLLFWFHVIVRETSIAILRYLDEPLFRSQCDHVGGHLQMEKLPYLTGVGRIRIGAHVRLSGKSSIGLETECTRIHS